MILGNKCDMADRRQVPLERGELVSQHSMFGNPFLIVQTFMVCINFIAEAEHNEEDDRL